MLLGVLLKGISIISALSIWEASLRTENTVEHAYNIENPPTPHARVLIGTAAWGRRIGCRSATRVASAASLIEVIECFILYKCVN